MYIIEVFNEPDNGWETIAAGIYSIEAAEKILDAYANDRPELLYRIRLMR